MRQRTEIFVKLPSIFSSGFLSQFEYSVRCQPEWDGGLAAAWHKSFCFAARGNIGDIYTHNIGTFLARAWVTWSDDTHLCIPILRFVMILVRRPIVRVNCNWCGTKTCVRLIRLITTWDHCKQYPARRYFLPNISRFPVSSTGLGQLPSTRLDVWPVPWYQSDDQGGYN